MIEPTGRSAEFLAFFDRPRRYAEFRDHFGISAGYASNFLDKARRNGWLATISRGLYVRPWRP